MPNFLVSYGLFAAETLTLLIAFAAAFIFVVRVILAARGAHPAEQLEVNSLNRHFTDTADSLLAEMLDRREWKRHIKVRAAQDKAKRKAQSGTTAPTRLFVLDFEGDVAATQTVALREEISAILQVATTRDEVLLRLESAGGLVHSYGLAASELRRLREHGLKLTIAVDKVAASGGYMMACVADHIIAAPFAVVGSIGVVAQLPNFHRLLKKNDIDIELHTAGAYKRTLTMLGENSAAAREKFLAELEDTHALFKAFVGENRPQVAIAEVATGEHWYGTRALALKLVDQLKTSDDYILERVHDHDIFSLRYRRRRSLRERLGGEFTRLATSLAGRFR
ncbi:MAG: protease SohB [Nevskiaceae bacterium]|nr:MAG: protease SohB [Nevskiaceae bacterium]TBR75100.1 MAG: protease SohB [Nevskiaceae bacterium]